MTDSLISRRTLLAAGAAGATAFVTAQSGLILPARAAGLAPTRSMRGGSNNYRPDAPIVDKIGGVAGTLALLALGLGLRKFGVSGNVRAALALAGLKLVVMPVIALVIVLYVMPLPPVWAKVAVIVAACPSGSNVYVVAARFRTGEGLASSTIVLAIALSVLSIAFWLNVVDLLL